MQNQNTLRFNTGTWSVFEWCMGAWRNARESLPVHALLEQTLHSCTTTWCGCTWCACCTLVRMYEGLLRQTKHPEAEAPGRDFHRQTAGNAIPAFANYGAFSHPDCTVGVGIATAAAHRSPAAGQRPLAHGLAGYVGQCRKRLPIQLAGSPSVGNWNRFLTLPRRSMSVNDSIDYAEYSARGCRRQPWLLWRSEYYGVRKLGPEEIIEAEAQRCREKARENGEKVLGVFMSK